jgi:cytidyltransferase-like protein|tara:strand:+ start:1231 stop:1635 length:405 start_codon:yes stop_codon:yes gene_type:complete
MKKVMAFGSFDVLHKGHEAYLKEARSYGKHLIVIVAKDENILRFKGRKAKHDEEYRLRQVKRLDFVDEAVLGHKDDIFEVLGEFKPNIVCLGYDQSTISEDALKNELKKFNITAKIVRAKSFKPGIYKSSILKK